MESEEKKKKRWKKSEQHLRDLQDTVKRATICTLGVPEEERQQRAGIFWNNGLKRPDCDTRYESINPRSESNSKWDELKETRRDTWSNCLKKDTESLKQQDRNDSSHAGFLYETISRFPIRNLGIQKAMGWYGQDAQRKKLSPYNSYPAKLSFKNVEKSRHFQINKSWGSLLPLALPCKKCSSESCWNPFLLKGYHKVIQGRMKK